MKESFDSVAYRNQYAKRKYDRLSICFPAGTKKLMLERAEELGYISKGKPSITAYLFGLYQADIRCNVTINLSNTAE